MATVLSRKPNHPAPETSDHLAENPEGELQQDTARQLVRLFKLLADETRLRILHFLLQHTELNVRSLCDLLDQSQPAVSHHLALLRVDGLIECRRDGKHNFYRIIPQRFEELMGMIAEATADGSPGRLDERISSFLPTDPKQQD